MLRADEQDYCFVYITAQCAYMILLCYVLGGILQQY